MRFGVIACFCVLAGALPAAAQNPDILGSWTVNFTLQSGPTHLSTLTLGNDGARFGAAPSQADSRVDVTGTWAMSVESAAGTGTPTVVLKQDGEKLTGQYSGQLGEAPLTGSVKGSAIEFSFDVSFQGTALHIVYAGSADASSMKGTVKLGDFGEGTFTGKKK
jgi:hypothetical protein